MAHPGTPRRCKGLVRFLINFDPASDTAGMAPRDPILLSASVRRRGSIVSGAQHNTI